MNRYFSKIWASTILCIVLSSVCLNTFAQNEIVDNKKLADKIEPQINSLMGKLDMPGAAVGVVEGNKVVYSRGFGVSDLKTNQPITPNTLFDMASIAKVFTTTAIMQLVEQGKIELDSPVIKYLSYFKLKDKRYKNITIRQLLTHTSGLPNGWNMNWSRPEYDDKALERFVRSLKNEKLMSEPGTKYNYSNTGFDILGDVISKVSGEKYEDYMKMHILQPLDMKESSFYKPDGGANLAKGYVQKGTFLDYKKRLQGLIAMRNRINNTPIEESPVYPYNRAHAPCSTLTSNIVDMCKWINTFINKNAIENNNIINNESTKEMWQPHTKTDIAVPKGMEYLVSRNKEVGLGWRLGDYRGFKTVGHGGSDVGFMTYFCILPEKSLGVVVFCNADYVSAEQIASFLLDCALGYETDIEKLGKPPKTETINSLTLCLPLLLLLFLFVLILKTNMRILLTNLLVLIIANIYIIIATTLSLWITISSDTIYLILVFIIMIKRRATLIKKSEMPRENRQTA